MLRDSEWPKGILRIVATWVYLDTENRQSCISVIEHVVVSLRKLQGKCMLYER